MSQPAPSARLTRDDVLRIGQSGRPWDFLPLAVKLLEQTPADQAAQFLLAANLARLGLRTLALEQLAQLPAEAQAHPDVANLAKAASALPSDRLTEDQRLSTCRANVAVLQTRGHDLTGLMSDWS